MHGMGASLGPRTMHTRIFYFEITETGSDEKTIIYFLNRRNNSEVTMCFSLISDRLAPTQRFVADSLKLRTARFEHAHRRFAELSHIDHVIKLCPLFVDLGDRARSGVQKSSNSVCTDI